MNDDPDQRHAKCPKEKAAELARLLSEGTWAGGLIRQVPLVLPDRAQETASS